MTFGKQPFVAIHIVENGNDTFAAQWKKDPTVNVRIFNRVVRAGGASISVKVVVVRRKVAAE